MQEIQLLLFHDRQNQWHLLPVHCRTYAHSHHKEYIYLDHVQLLVNCHQSDVALLYSQIGHRALPACVQDPGDDIPRS